MNSLIKEPIPEQPWNDSQYGLNVYNQYTSTGTTSIAGGSGGASNAAICCRTDTAPPPAHAPARSPAIPSPPGKRARACPMTTCATCPTSRSSPPTVPTTASIPSALTDGDCQTAGLGSGNIVQISGVGGTSASAPAFAGIMALVEQSLGHRHGQVDNILYALKTQYPAAFHDVTNGTNSVPCEFAPTVSTNCIAVSSPATVNGVTEGQIGTGTTPEYNATAGYNLATGLGTIDANVLVTDWSKVTLATSAVTMTPSQTSFAHGTPITISGTVTGSTPTGNVALMTDSTEPLEQSQTAFALSTGSYSGTTSALPGGTYHIWAEYGGDAKNAMSESPKVQITVSPETPGMNFNLFNAALGAYYTPSSGPGTSVDYGTQLMLSSEVAPTSQLTNLQNCVINGTGCSSLNYTQPTGTVTFADNSTTINTAVMNAEGDAEYNAPFAVGAHSVVATYNGDQSYNKIASSPITFTVIKDTPQFFWGASNVSGSAIIGGQPTVFNVIVENGAQYNVASQTSGGSVAPVPVAPPTGTVTLSSSPSGISGTITLSSGVDSSDGAQAGIGTVTLASLAANNYNVTFTYSGDANYEGGSAQGTITVVAGSSGLASTTAATMSGSISPNSAITITGTVTGQSGHPAPTGDCISTGVVIYSSGGSLGCVRLTAGSGDVSNFSAVLNSQDLFQGANFVTVQYTGDTVYAASEYNLNSGSSIPNPLGDFSLVPDTTIVPVSITSGAGTGTDTINVSSVNGFTGTVNLTCTPASGITCTVSPNPTLSNQGSSTSTLTVNVPAGTASGNYNVLITAKDAATGEYIHTLAITADVTGSSPAITLSNSGNITVVQGVNSANTSTITVTPSGGFTGTVNLTCAVTSPSPLPANPITCAAANLNPTSVNITNTNALTSVLTINTSGTTTTGAYVVTVTGTSGGVTSFTTVNVTVNLSQDFSLSNSGNITVNAGTNTSNTSTITVTPSGGFSSAVTLSCSVTTQPTGGNLTCGNSNLSPTSVTPLGTSTLTVNTTSSTTPGPYVITVTGTASTDVHTTTVNVTVNAAAAQSYTVTATGPTSNVSPGTAATASVTVTGSGGYGGTVALSCSLNSGGPTNQSGDAPSCSITSGASLNLGTTNPGTAVATVSSTAATADLVVPAFGKGKGWLGAGSGAVLALLFFFRIPARRRSWRAMLGILIAMVALGVMSSCGGGGGGGGGGGTNPTNPGTAAGTYTFTVTSTGSPAVNPAPANPTFTVTFN